MAKRILSGVPPLARHRAGDESDEEIVGRRVRTTCLSIAVMIEAMDTRAAKSGRKLALVAGLGALAVLVSAGLSWQSLAVQYHLFRLNREAEYFLQLLEKPRETLEGRALLQFVSTNRGLETLARATLKQANNLEELIADAKAAGHSVLPLYKSNNARTVTVRQTAAPVKAELLKLLSIAPRREFMLPEHPGVRFWVSIEDATELIGICVISRDEEPLASVH